MEIEITSPEVDECLSCFRFDKIKKMTYSEAFSGLVCTICNSSQSSSCICNHPKSMHAWLVGRCYACDCKHFTEET